MDLLHRHLMNRRLRLAEALEHRLGAIASGRGQPRRVDQFEYLGKTPMSVLMMVLMRVIAAVMVMLVAMIVRVFVDGEPGRRDAGAQHACGVDVRVAEREAAKGAFELVERQAGIEERAERHVAGDARKAVEVKRFHSRRDSLKLQ